MSSKQSDIFWENVKEEFETYLIDGDWKRINELRLKLSDAGYHEMEKELMDLMNAEELKEMKEWDEAENGGEDFTGASDIGGQSNDR